MKRIILLFALIVLAAYSVSATTQYLTLYDNFNDAALNGSKWNKFNESSAAGYSNVSEMQNSIFFRGEFLAGGGSNLGSWLRSNQTANTFNITVRDFGGGSSGGANQGAYIAFWIGNTKIADGKVDLAGSNPFTTTFNDVVSNQANQTYYAERTGAKQWSFYRNGTLIRTIDGVSGNLTVTFNISCSGACAGQTSNAYFIIDDAYIDGLIDSVTINSPINSSLHSGSNIFFNSSQFVSQTNHTNMTFYVWNSSGGLVSRTNMTLRGQGYNETFIYLNLSLGRYSINTLGCSTNRSSSVLCSFADKNNTIFAGLTVINETYNTTTYEGLRESFTINLTTADDNSLSAARLFYNGTFYDGSIIQASSINYLATRNITIPNVASQTNLSFKWVLDFTNGFQYNYTEHQQTVQVVSNLTVNSSCAGAIYEFSFQDEGNLTAITNMSVQYNFNYGLEGTISPQTAYGNLTGVTSFQVCVNSTQSTDWLVYEGAVFYSRSDYVERRYYIFNETRVSNNSLQRITLYDLSNSFSTSFQLLVQDKTTLSPYVGYYTSLLRWYPQINEYKTVEMGLTDDTGSTVIHVLPEDVDYRIAVYERNGTLIHLANPVRMICLVSPCTYTVSVEQQETDFISFLEIQYDLDFNETTGTWTFTYSDASQRTDLMNLTVYRLTGSSTLGVCESTSTAFTGILVCNTSQYTGTLKAVVSRVASPPIPIVQRIVTVLNSAFESEFGLWMMYFLSLIIIIVSATTGPTGLIIGSVIALLPLFYFGALGSGGLAIIGGFAVMAFVIMHFIKKT